MNDKERRKKEVEFQRHIGTDMHGHWIGYTWIAIIGTVVAIIVVIADWLM